MSTLLGVGFSEKKDPYLAGSEAAQMALYQVHHRPVAICFLFSTIHFSHEKLLEGVGYALGAPRLLGCSGANLLTTEGHKPYGVGVLLVSSESLRLGTAAAVDAKTKGARALGEEWARAALKDLGSSVRQQALIFPDGLIENGSELLRGIQGILGMSFPILGASSADNFRFVRTYQYFGPNLLSNSVVGAVVGGGLAFGMGLRHGWKPLGKPHVITGSRGNVVKTIDDKPAIELYASYFGKPAAEVAKNLARISAYYPLGLYVPGEREYILRNALRVDEEGGLVCTGDAAAGTEIRLMMGTKKHALAAATEAANEARASLKNCAIKGALVFESIARSKLLGRLTEEEMSRIKEILGDVPLLGISTYGEQAPLQSLEYHGCSHFHNETLAILAIGEPYGPGHSA
ncbi:MAG: FIST signal transduction protein [Deltaproteobacteria bacterium]